MAVASQLFSCNIDLQTCRIRAPYCHRQMYPVDRADCRLAVLVSWMYECARTGTAIPTEEVELRAIAFRLTSKSAVAAPRRRAPDAYSMRSNARAIAFNLAALLLAKGESSSRLARDKRPLRPRPPRSVFPHFPHLPAKIFIYLHACIYIYIYYTGLSIMTEKKRGGRSEA